MSSISGDSTPDEKLLSQLSEAKQQILKLLWSMEWVEGSAIFQVVKQTYYDRRIRELRESGWQIETVGTRYRLISREKLPGNERIYPNTQQKKAVRERDKGICQICGASDTTLQYDHKVPLERLGHTEVSNLQLLCRACNVEKRGVCRRCTLTTCDGCPYAYPEIFSSRMSMFFDARITNRVREQAQERGVAEWVVISEIIDEYFSNE